LNNPFSSEINRWEVFIEGKKVGEKTNFLPTVGTSFTLNRVRYLVRFADYKKYAIVVERDLNAR